MHALLLNNLIKSLATHGFFGAVCVIDLYRVARYPFVSLDYFLVVDVFHTASLIGYRAKRRSRSLIASSFFRCETIK